MSIDLEREKDPEVLRQAAILLESVPSIGMRLNVEGEARVIAAPAHVAAE